MAKTVLHKGKNRKRLTDRRWEQSGGAAARACASAGQGPGSYFFWRSFALRVDAPLCGRRGFQKLRPAALPAKTEGLQPVTDTLDNGVTVAATC
jgi:hypothetical protein